MKAPRADGAGLEVAAHQDENAGGALQLGEEASEQSEDLGSVLAATGPECGKILNRSRERPNFA